MYSDAWRTVHTRQRHPSKQGSLRFRWAVGRVRSRNARVLLLSSRQTSAQFSVNRRKRERSARSSTHRFEASLDGLLAVDVGASHIG